jgi:alpha-N-arabinofuranosidase
LLCEKRETCHGDAPLIATAVTYNEKMLTVFALNTDKNNRMELSVDARSFGKTNLIWHTVLCGEDLSQTNGPDMPDVVRPINLTVAKSDSGGLHKIFLEKASWNVIRFTTSS